MEAHSYGLASYLIGRGFKADGARIDTGNDRAYFNFPTATRADATAYHAVIEYLTALERLARKAGA